MSPPAITIAPCHDADVPDLQRFIHEHWRADHILSRDERLLRWQHAPQHMPIGEWPGPTFLLAKQEARIVGILGLIGCEANLCGPVAPAAWIAMWMSLPEVRTSGVGLKLMQAAIDLDFDALFVLGINDTVRPIYRRLGFQIIDDMPRWTRVINYDATARLLQACGQSPLPQPTPPPPSPTPPNPHLHIDTDSRSLGDAWNRFWREQLAPHWCGNDRSADYLNRRYLEHPVFDYETRVAVAESTGDTLGLAVFRIEPILDRTERVMRIVEFLAVPQAADALAQNLIEAGLQNGVAFADFYCASPLAAEPLVAAGFQRECPDSSGVTLPCRFQPLETGAFRMHGAIRLAKPLTSDSMAHVERDSLYITKADGDMDRPN